MPIPLTFQFCLCQLGWHTSILVSGFNASYLIQAGIGWTSVLHLVFVNCKVHYPHTIEFPPAKTTSIIMEAFCFTRQLLFSNFSCKFLDPNDFFQLIWIIIILIYITWEISRNKLKKHYFTKTCSDLSLFEQIVLVISKKFQILGLLHQISKVFLDHENIFFST